MPKILLVDDSESIRFTLRLVMERSGFDVDTAANVGEALKLIHEGPYDVLLSDLHMPEAGDGLTVVSAMRHTHPQALTLIFSGYPEMNEAAAAILLQADEILVKPLAVESLVETIQSRLKAGTNHANRIVENVALILEREANATIADWLQRTELVPEIINIPLDRAARSAHLPQMFRDMVNRLRHPLPLGARGKLSQSAAAHGRLRRRQGYTATMMVEESRMLQVSIFQTLQNNLHVVDFSLLLVGVMAIADEVDSQLAEAMANYVAESKLKSVNALDPIAVSA
jgi:CheY-like chemotaxis protein